MRKLSVLFTLSGLLIFASCGEEAGSESTESKPLESTDIPEEVLNKKGANIEFESQTISIDTVIEGAKVPVVFKFKNTGDEPLMILSARPTCGCTVSDPPKAPIQPGETGEIKATFDSKGRVGSAHKTLKVFTNVKTEPYDITFTGFVKKAND